MNRSKSTQIEVEPDEVTGFSRCVEDVFLETASEQLKIELVQATAMSIVDNIEEEDQADELIKEVGYLISDQLQGEQAEVVMKDVGDNVVEMMKGEPADELVHDVTDVVLSHLPVFSKIGPVKSGLKIISKKLVGQRADRIVEEIGDEIVYKLIRDGYSDELVRQSVQAAMDTLIDEGESYELVEDTVYYSCKKIVDSGQSEELIESSLDEAVDKLDEDEVLWEKVGEDGIIIDLGEDRSDQVAEETEEFLCTELSGERADFIVRRIGNVIVVNIREAEMTEEVVENIGELIGMKLEGRGADAVIDDVGDIVKERLKGRNSDELVNDVAKQVLEQMPVTGRFGTVRKALERITNKLLGERADRVVDDVGDVVVDKIVERGYADQLVSESVDIAIEEVNESGSPDVLFDDTLDTLTNSMVDEGYSEDFVADVVNSSIKLSKKDGAVQEVSESLVSMDAEGESWNQLR
ncbi:MAG: hypothetical protein ABEK59_03435 [Halobacteria archaeon]